MKKIILMLLAATSITFAQEKKQDSIAKIKEHTFSLLFNVQDGVGIGLSYEGPAKKEKILKMFQSGVIYVNLINGATLENSIVSYDGSGYEFGTGNRLYLNGKNNQGIYFQNFLTYGQIKYSETFFNGKYSYFTLINPDLGYKFKIAKVINVDLNAGFIWKWEMLKGQGDIDNKMFDNLVPRFGLRIGYIF